MEPDIGKAFVQNKHRHFVPLDGLRGIAVLLVILVHAFSYRGPSWVGRVADAIARVGWTGVVLFFVLSGFLITGILLDTRGKRHALRDFYARRSIRIFPLYFGFLVIYLLVVPLLTDRLQQPHPSERVLYYCYLVNYYEALTEHHPPRELAPLWSLSVEEQVYLVWPLVLTLTPWRYLPRLFFGAIAMSFLWRAISRILAQSIEISYSWSLSPLEAFAVGGLVAWLARHPNRAILSVWSPRITLASAVFIAGIIVGQRHFNFWDGPVQMLTLGYSGCVWLFGGIIGWTITAPEQGFGNRMLSVSVLRCVGRYSYAMYLFHAPVIQLIEPMVYSNHTGWESGRSLFAAGVMTVVTFMVSYCMAWVSWRVWESPWLILKKFFPTTGHVPYLQPANGPMPRSLVVIKPDSVSSGDDS